ncbi:MAG: response regulator receiver domain [Armatimonadota bacterium]
MPTPEATFHDLSRDIVVRFLQTVVVLDDRATFDADEPNTNKKPIVKVPGRGSVTSSEDHISKSSSSSANDPETDARHKLNAKKLIDTFADQGLICSVLKPYPDELQERTVLMEKTLKSVSRSDIVILDWQLDGDAGALTTEIIKRIVAEDKIELHRLRMIAIYTGETGLGDIMAKIKMELNDPSFKADLPFLLSNGRVRVVIYAKADLGIESRFHDRVASEEDLPEKLVNEFTEMTSGLIPNVALASLAALRDNAHRLLLKLNKKLDSAYIAHRCLLDSPEDAEQHILALVIGEIRSILSQAHVENNAALPAILAWLRTQQPKLPRLHRLFTETKDKPDYSALPATGIEDLSILLRIGCNKNNIKHLPKSIISLVSEPQNKIKSSVFSSSTTQGMDDDCELAEITASQTRYTASVPHLELGQIVENEGVYWICLHPRCDSVRIMDPATRTFLFLKCETVPITKKHDYVVRNEANEYIHLKVLLKLHESSLLTFRAHSKRKKVLPYRRFPSADTKIRWFFRSCDNVVYRWVTELKAEYAQELSNRFSSEIARVALDKTEWLRRT